jgi:hypothetical protein
MTKWRGYRAWVADCDVEAMATFGDRLVAIHSHAGQGTIWLTQTA